MRRFLFIQVGVLTALSFFGCSNPPNRNEETILTGVVDVLVDESLLPIIEDQLDVFYLSYPETELRLVAKPENQVVASLLRDSADVAILTRLLTAEENKYFENRQLVPRINRLATDAIALVTHNSSPDTSITVSDIIKVMRGEHFDGKRNLIFDNANSSTVRFLMELAEIDSLPASGVYALSSNEDVLKYVNGHPGTIGVVGVIWVNETVVGEKAYSSDIKVLSVKNLPGEPGDDAFYKPSQSNLAEGVYPLSRSIYYINGQPNIGLGMGFAAFLSGERGQRIILKAGLLPDSLPSRELILRKGHKY